MEMTINGNVTIGTKVDVAAGATYIHTKIDRVDTYNHTEMPEKRRQKTTAEDNIDSDTIRQGLLPYFGREFKGGNALKVDHLAELVDDICHFSSAKDQARIANMIFCSREMKNKPASFAAWYTIFCKVCGFERRKYDQNKVDDFEFLKKRFYYFTF